RAGLRWTLSQPRPPPGASPPRLVPNTGGAAGAGLGLLLQEHRIDRVIASYVGENKEFARQFLAGELQVELTPQGTLAERLRAGGAGIAAFFTPTGVGTLVADGGLPWRYAADGTVALSSPAKTVRTFDLDGRPRECVLEEALRVDVALVHARVADRQGNCVFNKSARNFNPLAAMAADLTIVEAETVVETGALDPDAVHLPGIYVHRVVPLTAAQASDKRIEKRTTRARADAVRES
ncbi:MAG: CoA transferase subunit A, partial [Actinomycetes bacterium]